ncbi:MAG TPA: riboflavin synthase [Pseudogracilibacillus sp.]|nr:riboflavin synthase [Pseudogracilibacillus sp.]
MFTGIIEEVGTIIDVEEVGKDAISLTIEASEVLEDIQLGESIAVNGICLTVAKFTDITFSVDVMPETMRATSLQEIKKGSIVNLERALRLKDRLGGHLVTGQVDGVGTITRKEKISNAVYMDIAVPESFLVYFVPKGSIAIDGISLTIFHVGKSSITLSLIPHTLQVTNLRSKAVGDLVNFECDSFAKHVHHQMNFYLKANR